MCDYINIESNCGPVGPPRAVGPDSTAQRDFTTKKIEPSSVSSAVSQSPIVYKGKRAACDATYVGKKLLWSTGKAAWIAGTTFLILAVPLIFVMDREQQLNELEMQQATLLGTPTAGAPMK
ncbi:Mitochondrial import receptor subunit TOM9-1 [Acorus calamus]|uniref:Mitochondrial import receptor subunit TOM9-1 n=1 Tax=Acorus calamus TaxID=4465 RepID=A0AAV9C734_ACOCL|nr:Mitochondrial import receptor subunit TOM9-1 [Acorus calamus]